MKKDLIFALVIATIAIVSWELGGYSYRYLNSLEQSMCYDSSECATGVNFLSKEN